ncbi:MAG: hypothetical protein JO090_03260 [Rhizobacter sp.]|nr:hypothetical protein [Rhizobacter sp.]
MPRRASPANASQAPAHVGGEHAALALREAAVLMAPIARWLLRNGVPYTTFVDALKTVFIDVARAEIESADREATISALSLLSGVHRKEVRSLTTESQRRGETARGVPLASQVYTRWLTARRYRSRDGSPKALPRTGAGASFETLARELSQDVHPRTVLDELLRLGLVRLDGELVVPASASFTPSRRLDELTTLFAANASDHIAAAVHNLTAPGRRFLEQAVFADGLSEASVEQLRQRAVAAWLSAFETMVRDATERVEHDAALDPESQHRMRFGVYFYSEPQRDAARGESTPAKPAPARARTPRKRRSS